MNDYAFWLFTVFAIIIVCGVCYVVVTLLLPYTNRAWKTKLTDHQRKRYELTNNELALLFGNNDERSEHLLSSTVRSDDYNSASINGPLIPLPCSQIARPCLTDRDCSIVCNGSGIEYYCDKKSLVCSEGVLPIGNDDDNKGDGNDNNDDNGKDIPIKCDTKNGEYALLQGYTEIGVAQWKCIQLYPGWEGGGKSYCEEGTVNLDTRIRTPSYKDCTCPSNTTRIVYMRSTLGQQVYGLPHCVKQPKLYNLGVDYLAL